MFAKIKEIFRPKTMHERRIANFREAMRVTCDICGFQRTPESYANEFDDERQTWVRRWITSNGTTYCPDCDMKRQEPTEDQKTIANYWVITHDDTVIPFSESFWSWLQTLNRTCNGGINQYTDKSAVKYSIEENCLWAEYIRPNGEYENQCEPIGVSAFVHKHQAYQQLERQLLINKTSLEEQAIYVATKLADTEAKLKEIVELGLTQPGT